ncbi:hypothetical protein [Haloquadratum walsbyi]|nr:hypothetical protein [Haloquadratum walsbyi]
MQRPTSTDTAGVRVSIPADSLPKKSGGMKFACGCGVDPQKDEASGL